MKFQYLLQCFKTSHHKVWKMLRIVPVGWTFFAKIANDLQIKDNIDLLMISETKLAERFPLGQFYIDGFGLATKLGRERHGGAIELYVREEIPIKLLS